MTRVVGERLRNHRALIVVCAAAAVVETTLVGAFAPTSSLALATQASAPPPFGVFHDLRWIVVYHESWIGLAGELLAFLAIRSLLTAVCLRAAWPHDVAPEPWSVTVRRSVLFTVIAAVLLAPWAALMFALAVVSLSWLFFVAIPVVLMLALLVHGGAVTNSWWRCTLSVRSLGWVLVAFVALTAFGSLMTTCPAWARVPVAVLAGSANAWIWLHVVDAVLHPRRLPHAFPVAPVGVAGVLVLVVGGTTAGFALSKTPALHFVSPAEAATQWTPPVSRAGTPLVVVTGFDTEWDGRADQYVRVDLPQWRFSYRGASAGAPLPYTAVDTHRALPELVRELRRQVSMYHRATGKRLTVVAESEGALLAKAYLAATPHAPVDNLVVLSPLVEPGRVYYPARGDEGWGAGGALAMEGFAWALDGVSPVDVTPDTPFLRSIVDDAPAMRRLMACSLRSVRQLAVLPLDTGVSAPAPEGIGIPYTVVPAFHGGMLDDERTASVVARVVSGEHVATDTGWSVAEDVIQAGASAWQVPQLTVGINAAWSHEPDPGDCRASGRTSAARCASAASLRLGLALLLLLLLPRTDAEQGFGGVDVGDRARVGVAERAGVLLPARGCDVESLAEYREEDLRFLFPEAGKRAQTVEQHLGILHIEPDRGRVTVVVLDDVCRERVRSLRHRRGIAMQRRLLPEHRFDFFGTHRRDGLRVERAESFAQRRRPAERPLHRDLLVEQHAHEQREGIGDEQFVGFGITGDRKYRSCHGEQPTDARRRGEVPRIARAPSVL